MTPPPQTPAPGDIDPVDPPVEVLRRYGARVLDPVLGVRRRDGEAWQQPVRSTSYVSDTLLAPRSRVDRTVERLVAFDDGPQADQVQRSRRRADQLAERGVDVAVPIRLTSRAPGVAAVPDAWTWLQRLRAADPAATAGVGLDHLAAVVRPPHEPVPIGEGGSTGPGAASGYVLNGRTRLPVTVLLPDLPRSPDPADGEPRRPVVAVVDSGCGEHRWLPDDIVTRWVYRAGDLVPEDRLDDPESDGDLTGPLTGALDWVSGHGTFIAGVVRQACPDADLVSVRVVRPDGVVLEDELHDALQELLLRAQLAAAAEPGGQPLDVLSLSLGYYHEDPADAVADGPWRTLLQGFLDLGVTVVAAAGNESTLRPFFPAAFAADPADPPLVTSVGARNPNGTVALFSNSGDWVRTWAAGGLVVSTMPQLNAGATAVADLADRFATPPAARSDVDPDDFGGGFGVWSGTSFAAPLVAGQVAVRRWRPDGDPR